MSRVGFEPTTPLFERASTVHALNRAATVIGSFGLLLRKMFSSWPRLLLVEAV
jgi:hypothetical protein